MERERELASTKTFIKQLEHELEFELLGELDVRHTRALRLAVREAIRDLLRNEFKSNLRLGIEDLLARAREAVAPAVAEIREKTRPKETERFFQRLNLSIRIQHMVMALSVMVLIVTGLPLKFPDNPLFQALMGFFGGIENSTLLHRASACGLIAVSLWHLVYITCFREGRRDFGLMLPRRRDIGDFFQRVNYFLGRSGEGPKFGRFSYVEKFDYWAVYWGCVLMIGTGILLWSPDYTFAYFPKYFYDIAKEVHSDEALLATLAIVIWHFYNVHFNPTVFPGSLLWWHGRVSEHDMKEEHPAEYEEIMAREAEEAGTAQEDSK